MKDFKELKGDILEAENEISNILGNLREKYTFFDIGAYEDIEYNHQLGKDKPMAIYTFSLTVTLSNTN